MRIPLKAMLRGTFRLSMRGKGIKEGICSCIVALPAQTKTHGIPGSMFTYICSPDITYGVESVNVAGQSAPLQICVRRLCMLIVLNIQR